MFGSDFVDVGVGMAMLFLFMSLIASTLREVIENVAQSRARDLERGIKELLQEDNAREALLSWIFGLPLPTAEKAPAPRVCSQHITVKELYNHPLIQSLYRGSYSPGDRRLPAYIPRRSFATAVLDLAARATETGKPLSMATLKASLPTTAPNPVQRVVLTALDTAGNDIDKVRATLEDWYDATMDRVSGWYTKRTARIVGALGFLAAAFFNIDAIAVAQHLITDRALRSAVVSQAGQIVKTGKPGTGRATDGGNEGFRDVAEIGGELKAIGFPMGWAVVDRIPYPIPQACEAAKQSAGVPVHYTCRADYSLLLAVLGWIITGLAVMLGAPFWFDILNKFMIVRSTIKPKEKSPDEASVDRSPPNSDRTQLKSAS